MTYQTVALGVVLGLAAYNIAAGILDLALNKYQTFKLERVLDRMDWYEIEPPAVKKAHKKKK